MTDAVMLMASSRSSRKLGMGTSMTKTTETAAAGTIQSKFAVLRPGRGFGRFRHQEFLRAICWACMLNT